jgi:AbiV family abortive infection protein
MGMTSAHFIEAAAACLSNGERLIEDAKWLPEDRSATTFALATIAQEEFAKAFLLFLASRNAIPWNSLIFRATRDHASKQLLGLVMNYLNPTWEDFESRVEGWHAQHEEWQKLMSQYSNAADKNEKEGIWNQLQQLSESRQHLPDSIADALNILRYEKVGRWESSHWFWDEDPAYDAMAKGLAEGKLDIEKQDALYVRIGQKGGLARTPNEVRAADAAKALEMAGRLGGLVEGLLSGNNVNSIEYERIESAFRAIFANFARDES